MVNGKIYIISADIFKSNIYKVGRSRNFVNRLKAYKTSFGSEPIIHMEKEINNDKLIEGLIHIKLKKYRFKDKNDIYSREHYQIELSELIQKINDIIDYIGDDYYDSDIDDDDNYNEHFIEE